VVNVIAAVIFTDLYTATGIAGKLVVVSLVLTTGYQTWVCIKMALRKPRPLGTRTMLACWFFFGVFGSVDFIAWLGWGEPLGGFRTATLGLAIFAFLQGVLLSREHFHSLKRADDLNFELATRVELLQQQNARIQRLNEEMRHQIANRSRQMFAAMALLDGAATPPRLEPGDEVQSRYRVVAEIGRGGMGYVYEVERLRDGRHLALKAATRLESIALARFAREAQIAAEMNHANLVSIVDVDVAEVGFLYLVMELVEGTTLEEQAEHFGDEVWARHVLAQIANGLSALHEHGIVHRDLKPANVLVTGEPREPTIKITDFGVASFMEDSVGFDDRPAPSEPTGEAVTPSGTSGTTEDTASVEIPLPRKTFTPSAGLRLEPTASESMERMRTLSITQAGRISGTPHYIAPELAEGPGAVTPLADLFSFGVIGYQLLAGERPFSEPAINMRLEGQDIPKPTPLSERMPGIDPALAAIIEMCLEPDPALRPSTAELCAALGARDANASSADG
jgi:serine/threonine-protein kinase